MQVARVDDRGVEPAALRLVVRVAHAASSLPYVLARRPSELGVLPLGPVNRAWTLDHDHLDRRTIGPGERLALRSKRCAAVAALPEHLTVLKTTLSEESEPQALARRAASSR